MAEADEQVGQPGPSHTHAPTSALRVPNYRRFFIGNSMSNIGNWFQLLAQSLLVLRLTHSGAILGEVVAAQTLPQFFSPFIAPYLDRANLRRVQLVANTAAGAEALTLGILTSVHAVSVPIILSLSVVLGAATLFFQPAGQALVSELVPRQLIPNAASLFAVQQSIGRLAGPALSALLFAWKGPGACFDLNAVSFFVVDIALLSLRRDQMLARTPRARSTRQLRETLSYAWGVVKVRDQLLANTFIGLLAFNFPIYFSSFSVLVLHHGNAQTGAITFGSGESINAGCATVAGVLLSRHLKRPRFSLYVVACMALGIALGIVAITPNIPVFLFVAMPIFGVATVTYFSVNQGTLQTSVPSERVGSVMTLSVFGLNGTSAPGSLLAGWLIAAGSPRVAIAVGATSGIGAGLLLGVRLFRDRSELRKAAITASTALPAER